MMRRSHNCKIAGLALSALLACSIPLNAADLKQNIAVDERIVTLGDLFTDTGEKHSVAVLEAPLPGKVKTVSASELVRIAKKYDLDWQRPDFLKRVSVQRYADTIPTSDVAAMILELAINEGANPDSQLRLLGRNSGLTVPVGTTVGDVGISDFALNDRKDRFTAVLDVPTGGDAPARLNVTGMLEEVRDIPVFSRSVMPGDVIKQSDISWIKFPAKRLSARVVLSSSDLVGKTVRRPSRTEKPITTNDVVAPIAIAKGDAVTMMVRTKAMILTAAGKALENGGIGDTIRVLNPKSRQTVDAKIIRSGQVEILAGPTLALGSR